MTNKTDLLKNLLEVTEAGDLDKVASMITDSFTFSGPVPEPLNKQGYLAFLKGNSIAFSEFKYNSADYEESENLVKCNVQVSGKHTGELAVPGMDPIPATNKAFKLPQEAVTATFEGEKISKLEAATSPDGGIKGIIKQLTT